jgi:hypothetical protein
MLYFHKSVSIQQRILDVQLVETKTQSKPNGVTGWYRKWRPMHYDHFQSNERPHLSSTHS